MCSIRFPALHCGVAGLKPSFGRVPAYLPSGAAERPLLSSMMSVQGPLARCVADLKLALAVMARGDARDPWWTPAPLEGEPVPRRVGLVDHVAGVDTSPAVARGLDDAARALRAAAYTVERTASGAPDAFAVWGEGFSPSVLCRGGRDFRRRLPGRTPPTDAKCLRPTQSARLRMIRVALIVPLLKIPNTCTLPS